MPSNRVRVNKRHKPNPRLLRAPGEDGPTDDHPSTSFLASKREWASSTSRQPPLREYFSLADGKDFGYGCRSRYIGQEK